MCIVVVLCFIALIIKLKSKLIISMGYGKKRGKSWKLKPSFSDLECHEI